MGYDESGVDMLDIKVTMDEISRLEKLKAQVEFRSNQIKEQERILNEKLSVLNIKPEELEMRIASLEASISERLTYISSLDGSDPTAV